ncbi:hypothetical protein CBR_g55546 [Chara braunii]|uniref:Uncharacterized protein n=1 Tax=Chara braunii TaxID=69332 RepID=A0A388MD23_CHABU|nr:hypothetical protein CBR_g55546 [Chara braunii]|eukprot:GBG92466.1 hypothetical protein CBR_g55546 [Chara braunii]
MPEKASQGLNPRTSNHNGEERWPRKNSAPANIVPAEKSSFFDHQQERQVQDIAPSRHLTNAQSQLLRLKNKPHAGEQGTSSSPVRETGEILDEPQADTMSSPALDNGTNAIVPETESRPETGDTGDTAHSSHDKGIFGKDTSEMSGVKAVSGLMGSSDLSKITRSKEAFKVTFTDAVSEHESQRLSPDWQTSSEDNGTIADDDDDGRSRHEHLHERKREKIKAMSSRSSLGTSDDVDSTDPSNVDSDVDISFSDVDFSKIKGRSPSGRYTSQDGPLGGNPPTVQVMKEDGNAAKGSQLRYRSKSRPSKVAVSGDNVCAS